jgi:hypothetical protein
LGYSNNKFLRGVEIMFKKVVLGFLGLSLLSFTSMAKAESNGMLKIEKFSASNERAVLDEVQNFVNSGHVSKVEFALLNRIGSECFVYVQCYETDSLFVGVTRKIVANDVKSLDSLVRNGGHVECVVFGGNYVLVVAPLVPMPR